jgi:hypothetical protein
MKDVWVVLSIIIALIFALSFLQCVMPFCCKISDGKRKILVQVMW